MNSIWCSALSIRNRSLNAAHWIVHLYGWQLCKGRTVYAMGLLPDTSNCGLRMRRECWEHCPRHQLQRKALVSDPGMHHGTCMTHVPWCMPGSLTCGDGENVPGIPGACATRNFPYLVRGPCRYLILALSHYIHNFHLDCLGQGCSNSIANATELPQSCAKPSIYIYVVYMNKACHVAAIAGTATPAPSHYCQVTATY